MNPLQFGAFKYDGITANVLLNIAKGCYVFSRSTLQMKGLLFYFPVSFILMHHSIEGFVKVFLQKEGIRYERIHELKTLLELGAKTSRLAFCKTEILANKSMMNLLNELSKHYTSNKYGEAGFSMKSVSLISLYDDLINIFVTQLSILYPEESKQNQTFDVPETLFPFFVKDLNTSLNIVVWPVEADGP